MEDAFLDMKRNMLRLMAKLDEVTTDNVRFLSLSMMSC
jgi:hypothetical protein